MCTLKAHFTMTTYCKECLAYLSQKFNLDQECEQEIHFAIYYDQGYNSTITPKLLVDVIQNNCNKILHLRNTDYKDMRKDIFSMLLKGDEDKPTVGEVVEENPKIYDHKQNWSQYLLEDEDNNTKECEGFCKRKEISDYDGTSVLSVFLSSEITTFENQWSTEVFGMFGVVRFRCHKKIDQAPTLFSTNSGRIKLLLKYEDVNNKVPHINVKNAIALASDYSMMNNHGTFLLTFTHAISRQPMIKNPKDLFKDIRVFSYSSLSRNNLDYCMMISYRVIEVIYMYHMIHTHDAELSQTLITLEDAMKHWLDNFLSNSSSSAPKELDDSQMEEIYLRIPNFLQSRKIPKSIMHKIYSNLAKYSSLK